jgi:hypothetical protein
MTVHRLQRIVDCIALRTRSKVTKARNNNKSVWVSATSTHNYMLNDGICDWLKLYGKIESPSHLVKSKHENKFTSFIMEKGNEFEKEIIKYLKSKFKCIKVADFYTLADANRTIDFMKMGVPIIYSAPVYNKENKTYGIVDLLVRSDYVNKMFKTKVLTNKEQHFRAPFLNGNYHYRVIDIKYSTLNLSSDGIHLLNSGRNPAYKSQLYVYNEAISNFQGYNCNKAYIMGRRWKYTKNSKTYSGTKCDDKLATVDFNTYDHSFIHKSRNAINWYTSVVKDGIKWTVYPPSNNELYPNMCVDSYNWNTMKNKIAKNNGEITMLWNCGIKNRMNAFHSGVYGWTDDKCNSSVLGFKKGTNKSTIVDNMIVVNRDDPLLLPEKIGARCWKSGEDYEMYVDFETLNDVCMDITTIPKQKPYNIIYMIGVGYKKNDEWCYKSFVCKDTTKKEEKRIMKEFYNFYESFNKPPVYYWCAESNMWNKSCKTHSLHNTINWTDMCNIFKQESIVIKGCFGFGLKEICRTMKGHNMISTKLESECNNGMMAMIKAINCYKSVDNPSESPIMKDIEKYNEYDCKALFDIMNFLRKTYN